MPPPPPRPVRPELGVLPVSPRGGRQGLHLVKREGEADVCAGFQRSERGSRGSEGEGELVCVGDLDLRGVSGRRADRTCSGSSGSEAGMTGQTDTDRHGPTRLCSGSVVVCTRAEASNGAVAEYRHSTRAGTVRRPEQARYSNPSTRSDSTQCPTPLH
jgi:hypothetical protein